MIPAGGDLNNPGQTDYPDGGVPGVDRAVAHLSMVVLAPGPDRAVRLQGQTVIIAGSDSNTI